MLPRFDRNVQDEETVGVYHGAPPALVYDSGFLVWAKLQSIRPLVLCNQPSFDYAIVYEPEDHGRNISTHLVWSVVQRS